MSNLDLSLVSIYLALTLVSGLWFGRNVKNIKEYAIGGRNFSTTVLVMTICATDIGGSTIMTSASEAFRVGLIDMYTSIGLILSNLVIAYFIAPRFKRFLGAISVGDIMHEFYGNAGRYVAAIAGTLVCLGFVAGQVKALSTFFNYFLDLNVNTATYISCLIIVAYSSFGGIRAVTFTDVIQFLTLAVAIPMIFNIGLEVVHGYGELFKKIPSKHILPTEPTSIIKYFILFVFFTFPGMNPSTMQRILMAKDVEQIKNSFKISAFVLLPFLFTTSMIGLIVLSLQPDIAPSNVLMFLIDTYLPAGLKGVAFIGMIAVVMSTADSYMNAAGVSFIHDLIKPMFKESITEKQELSLARYFTLVSGFFSIVIALSFDNLLKLILFAQGFYVPIISVPLLLGLFGFRSSQRAFVIGASAGALTFILWHIYRLECIIGFDSLVPGLLMNVAALLTTHYILKEPGGWIKGELSIKIKRA
ncbi:MAG: sodium:solute symporter family protein [Rickettsiaceae bacterium]|jgi:Na+/proline symporter|nr:sodium:solute symporter family protein [Rickettsiaceae bacterium]